MATHPALSLAEITRQFQAAIMESGMEPPRDIIADGQLHRFASNGNPSDTAGYYTLHPDGIPAGVFGCWRAGFKQNWRADIGRPLSRKEQDRHRERLAAIQQQRQQERQTRQQGAAGRALATWEHATKPQPDHPYLITKGVPALGIREFGGLVIPLMDTAGNLRNLQTIKPDGKKLFLPGGRVKGLFHLIGGPIGGRVHIAEGYATGATLHQHLTQGGPVAVAFNAGNLEAVAKAIKAAFPKVEITIAADNDHRTEGNPGLAKGRAAARAVGGKLIYPRFESGSPGSDFNDWWNQRGRGEVAA